MRKLDAYKTRDGVIHETYQDAKKHAENAYGDQLYKMSHKLVQIGKYSEMVDALDGSKGSMRRLLDLAEDLVIYREDY